MPNAIEIYNETGDFYETCKRSGLNALTCHVVLAKAGVLKISDKIKFGTRAQRLGGLAEQKFQELVPEAIDANRMWKQNNPSFDFYVNGLRIDVKYSSLREKDETWGIDVGHKYPDLYCVFCEREVGKELDDFYLLLIPNGFVKVSGKLHISKSGTWFNHFRIEPDQLNDIMKIYSGLIKEVEISDP